MSLFDTPKVKAKRISGSNNPAIITISDDENTNLTSTPGPSRKVNASYSNISKLNGHSFQRHESNLSTKSTIGENNDRSKFFIPLNAYTSEIHRESVMKILLSNTFLVAPDIFFRAKIAAIVAYNFYKNFPNCGIVFIGSKELELQMELCKTLGIPTNLLFDFTKESKRKKLIGEKLSGVFFVQAQAYIKNIQEHFRKVPLKLLVINEAEKAQGSNALSKLVTSTMNSLFGDDYQGFRILALASSIERNLPKAQSLIANLNISNLMIKNYDDTTFTKALYSKDSFVYDIDVGEQFKQHLSSWREGTKNFTEFLVSANFLNESEPDALIFHDFEKWSKKTSFDDPVFINLFEVVPALIEAYKILICHGYRAFFLFLTAQIPKTSELLEKIMENSFLKEVYQFSIENFGYDAFPDRETISFEEMSKMHPKMPRLIDLLNEILTPKCPKIMIFCGNFFASRAVAELLNNWNAGRVLENWSEYSEQLLESRLLGPAQQDEKWLANRFKQGDENILVCSPYMQNFGFVTFGTAIGLDSEVSTMAFMRFGHKNYSLLTTPYETLPRSIWCFDKYEQHVKLSFDYRFRMETSKELFTKDMCESPIEFWPKIVDPPKEKKGQKRRKNDLLENEEKKPEQSFSSIVRNMPTPTEDDVAECFREVPRSIKRQRINTEARSISVSDDFEEVDDLKRRMETPSRKLITDHFRSLKLQNSDFVDLVAEASKDRLKALDKLLRMLQPHVKSN